MKKSNILTGILLMMLLLISTIGIAQTVSSKGDSIIIPQVIAKEIIKDLEEGDKNKKLLILSTAKVDTLYKINTIQKQIIDNSDRYIGLQDKIIDSKDSINNKLFNIIETQNKNTGKQTNKILIAVGVLVAVLLITK